MKPLLSVVFAMLFSVSAWAGGSAVLESSGGSETVTLEYEGQRIRLSASQQERQGEYLLIDGTSAYAVSHESGQPRVLDMAVMGQMFGAMAGAVGQLPTQLDHIPGTIEHLKPLQHDETVAGIVGQVYELLYTDNKGQQHTIEVVLSTEPQVVELAGAMLQVSQTLATVFGQPTAPLERFNRLLLGEGRGLLRVGDDMRVLSLNGVAPSADRFVLPATPSALPDFGVLLDQAAKKAPEVVEALDDMFKALEELQKR